MYATRYISRRVITAYRDLAVYRYVTSWGSRATGIQYWLCPMHLGMGMGEHRRWSWRQRCVFPKFANSSSPQSLRGAWMHSGGRFCHGIGNVYVCVSSVWIWLYGYVWMDAWSCPGGAVVVRPDESCGFDSPVANGRVVVRARSATQTLARWPTSPSPAKGMPEM